MESEFMQEVVETVAEVVAEHPFLTTPFEEYTVTEGLLLLLLLAVFIAGCIYLFKGRY